MIIRTSNETGILDFTWSMYNPDLRIRIDSPLAINFYTMLQ